MKLIFRESDHTYWAGERRLPSVSEILAPVVDLSGIPEHILNRKRTIGKYAHRLCEWYDQGEEIDPDSIDPAVAPYFAAWKKFRAEVKFKVLRNEEQAFDLDLGYAGTPDRVIEMLDGPKREWMLDIKTVRTLSPVTGLQTAGYALLLKKPEMLRCAVQLKDDGTYVFKEYTKASDLPTFRSLLTINHWKAQNVR